MRTKRGRSLTVLLKTTTSIVHAWTDAKGVEHIFAQVVVRATFEGEVVGGAVHPMLVSEPVA